MLRHGLACFHARSRPAALFVLVALFGGASSGKVCAQGRPFIGAAANMVHSRHLDVSRLLLSPEIVAGFLWRAGLVSLDGSLYGTYRREGPRPSCPHCTAYDYDEYLVGVRVSATLSRALLPLCFSSGLSGSLTVAKAPAGGVDVVDGYRLVGTYASFGIGRQYTAGKDLLVKPSLYTELCLGRERIPARIGAGIALGYLL